MTVITLSRQWGARGEEIAIEVARILGLRLIDAETINQAAHKAGVPQVALAELQQEGERGLANQMLKALRTMPDLRSAAAGGWPSQAAGERAAAGEAAPSAADLSRRAMPFAGLFSPIAPPISSSLESYVRTVGLVIRGLGREGNVLVLGRGGQSLLRKHPGALHVLVVAPQADRVAIVAERLDLSKRAAQARVRSNDRARADYLRRYHGIDWLDPVHYHLTINAGWMPVATAVELIVSAAGTAAGESTGSQGDV